MRSWRRVRDGARAATAGLSPAVAAQLRFMSWHCDGLFHAATCEGGAVEATGNRDAAPGDGRGGAWVVAQFALLGAILCAPRRGPRWPLALARPARALGLASLVGGGGVLTLGFLNLGPNLTPLPKPKDDATLVQEGLYAYLRHPIYSGVLLLSLGWALLTANTTRLLLVALLARFFEAKADREEAWLLIKFPDYAAYRGRVRRFLPGLYCGVRADGRVYSL